MFAAIAWSKYQIGVVLGIIALLLVSNAMHEAGHAFVAWWSGDRRDSIRNRMTLNPLKHVSLLLTIILPILSFLLLQWPFGGAKPVMVAFRKAGLADDMRSQFIGYAADIIECRIRDLNLSTTVQPRLAARMLAGALIESIDWWFDHESIAVAEIDTAFHLLARTVIAHRSTRLPARDSAQ